MTVLNVIRRPVTVNVQGRGLMGYKGDKGDPGNLTGPASSVDENIPIFDGIAGDKLKDSGVKLSDKADVSDFNTLDQTVDTLIPVIANTQSRLSAQEALLTGYNPTGADRVDISTALQSVALPINAAEGGVKVVQAGMTLENLVTNGDFSNGTTGWTAVNGSVNTSTDNTLINTASASSRLPYVLSTNAVLSSLVSGIRIYSRARVRVRNTLCKNINVETRYLNTGEGVKVGTSGNITNPVKDQWYIASNIIEYKSTDAHWSQGAIKGFLQHIYDNTTNSTGAILETQKFIVFNLTAHGMTSWTREQLDALPPEYFEGLQSVTAQRIKVVDADDARPTYQYVEPLPLRRLADGTRDTIENGTHIQRVSDDGTTALATPIVTYGVATGVPIAYPSGTITLEPVLADVGYYTDKFEINRTGYPVVSLETLSIVDLATGQLTPLDISTAVIAGDGLSFTHADLTAGNLVDVTYVWNYDGVYGENTFGYLDSTVVKADTANGKFYKAVPSFTNGVLTWTAEEVI